MSNFRGKVARARNQLLTFLVWVGIFGSFGGLLSPIAAYAKPTDDLGAPNAKQSQQARVTPELSPIELQERVNKLVNMQSRPTITEIERELTPWPKQNPFQPTNNTAIQAMLQTVQVSGSQFIAGLEKAYPGATYAFLGRDSVFLADVVDAFYRAHGQNHRVVRLNASGTSFVFNAGKSEQETLVAFLATNGLHIETVDIDPPFILLDATSYGLNSQSHRIIRAFYTAYERQTGKSAKNLIRKFNVLDTRNSNISPLDSQFDVDQFLSQQESVASTDGPTHIMKIAQGTDLAYTAEWHNSFGTFQWTADGKVFAPPGALIADTQRNDILALLYEVINTTRTEQFFERVQAAAKSLGYTFPEGRVRERTDLRVLTSEEIAQQIVDHARDKFKTLLEDLKTVGEDQDPFSTNGAQVYAEIKGSGIFDNNSPVLNHKSILALTYLAGCLHAYETKKISARDLRRIIKRVLAYYPPARSQTGGPEHEAFERGVLRLYNQSVTFQEVWDSKREYFLDPSHKSGPLGSQVYQELDQFIRSHGRETCSEVMAKAH